MEIGQYKVFRINSKPPRLEAKVVLDRDNISQKLIFTLMEISYNHGFACSPPTFKDAEDPDMIFLIGNPVQILKNQIV